MYWCIVSVFVVCKYVCICTCVHTYVWMYFPCVCCMYVCVHMCIRIGFIHKYKRRFPLSEQAKPIKWSLIMHWSFTQMQIAKTIAIEDRLHTHTHTHAHTHTHTLTSHQMSTHTHKYTWRSLFWGRKQNMRSLQIQIEKTVMIEGRLRLRGLSTHTHKYTWRSLFWWRKQNMRSLSSIRTVCSICICMCVCVGGWCVSNGPYLLS